MSKKFHIIFVDDLATRVKSFQMTHLTFKFFFFLLILSVPLFVLSGFFALRYQAKLTDVNRMNAENQQLYANRDDLLLRLARLERGLAIMKETTGHLAEIMEIDTESLRYNGIRFEDMDFTFEGNPDEFFAFTEGEELGQDWEAENGQLTSGRFNRKVGDLAENAKELNRRLEEIYSKNRDRISFMGALPDILPLEGWVTSDFGTRIHPISRARRMHYGLDIASPVGSKIRAPSAGKIVFAGRTSGYGNAIVLQHGFGIMSLYAHLKTLKVARGDFVGKGDVLGLVGLTGSTTGAHLHYEIQVDGVPTDPMLFIVP